MFSSYAAAAFLTSRRCSPCCSIWRRRLFSTTAATEQKQQKGAPLLMLSSPKNPETRYFYELNGNDIKFKREIHLPDIAGHHCIGSSENGFLITVDISSGRSTEIHVTNPFTGQRIPLPPIASLSDIDSSFYFSCRNHDPSSPPIPWYPDLIPLDTNYTHLYRSKAMLSHSFLFLVRDFLPPVFTPLSTSSSSSSPQKNWCPHHLMFAGLDDYIFHKGLLHAVLENGVLVVANLDNPFVTATVLPFQHPCLETVKFERVLSLLESPEGDDLFLVSRVMFNDKHVDDARLSGWKELHPWPLDDPPRFTHFFNVFRLEYEERRYRWSRVKSIGDLAMFVGTNSRSFSVSTRDFPHLKPNCIYYTDTPDRTWEKFLIADRDGDTGVYRLEDGGIQLFTLTDGTQELNWPPPVWYTPPPTTSPSLDVS